MKIKWNKEQIIRKVWGKEFEKKLLKKIQKKSYIK